MSIRLRSGLPEEAQAVLALWDSAGAEPTLTDDVASIVQLLEHDPEAVILAEENGRVVGSAIAAWDGWRGSVYRLVVAPSHRRQGLGRRLLTEAEARLSTRGAARLAAIVVEDDPLATGFWRGSGWQEQRLRLRFVTSTRS